MGKKALPILLILAATLVRVGAVGYDFVWDDYQYILENPQVDPARPLDSDILVTRYLGYPIPMPVLAYRTLASVFGYNPGVFHGFNLLVHLITGLLVFALLSRFLGRGRGLAAALLWSLHPLAVEPVTWCTGLKDLLMTCFTLASLLMVPDKTAGRARARLGWLLVLVFGAAAVASKPTAAAIPLLVAVLVLADSGPGGLLRPRVLLVVAGLAGLVGLSTAVGLAFSTVTDGTVGFVTVTTAPVTLGARLVLIFQGLGMQVSHFFLPLGLEPQYLRDPGEGLLAPSGLLGLAASALIVAGLVAGLRSLSRARAGQLPRTRLLLLVLFLLAFGPVSQVIPINRFVADSYMYLPSVFLIGLLVSLVPTRFLSQPLRRQALALGLVAALLAGLTLIQQPIWTSPKTLWAGPAARYPGSGLMQKRYALALFREGDEATAGRVVLANLELLTAQDQLDPFTLALVSRHGEVGEALAAYRHAPRTPEVWRNFVGFLLARHPELGAEDQVLLEDAARGLAAHLRAQGNPGALRTLILLTASYGRLDLAEELKNP